MGGLLCGLHPFHLRLLVDDPWAGGCGYQGDVGSLTLDQIFMRLANKNVLKAKMISGGIKASPLVVASDADADGMLRGRASDGTLIKGRVRGKSVARQLMEEEQAKAEAEKSGRKRRRRRTSR